MARYQRGTQVGIFRLDEEISEGGMGAVYKATITEDRQFPYRNDAQVALKFAANVGQYGPTFREILEEETTLLRSLHHPGVVRIFPIAEFKMNFVGRAVNLTDRPFYFAMELLYPKSLKHINVSQFPLNWRLEMLYQLAMCINYVHATRHTHQDLKPENVMFRAEPRKNQPVPQPVLIDFGLAKKRSMAQQQSKKDRAMSVPYAGPERVRHMRSPEGTAINYDYRQADVWAFGAIAYEVINGRYVFESHTSASMSRTDLEAVILNKQPDPMEADVPSGVKNLIHAMLHSEADRRPRMSQIVHYMETEIGVPPPRT